MKAPYLFIYPAHVKPVQVMVTPVLDMNQICVVSSDEKNNTLS